ncbi:MAG: imidazoleglycerol-phosphate dehydratase HisB [bacterium]
MSRTSTQSRETRETNIEVKVDLDNSDDPSINTTVPFFDHMLEQLGKHSGIGLVVNGEGDTEVDSHHLVEDIGIVLGRAFDEALGDRTGINRYASISLPFDETLVRTSIDISGRGYLDYNVNISGDIEGFPLEVLPEFFRGLVNEAGLTLHIDEIKSGNKHHLSEAVFKSFARALRSSVSVVGDDVPSTKGTLS